MILKLETVKACEEDILRQLDDGLFYGEIARADLDELATLEPVTNVDSLVCSAVHRALNLTIPERMNGILTTRRKGRQ